MAVSLLQLWDVMGVKSFSEQLRSGYIESSDLEPNCITYQGLEEASEMVVSTPLLALEENGLR